MRSNTSAIRPLYSGEFARLAGVSTDTLHCYEHHRLLPAAPRSAAGYLLFPPEALLGVKLIRGALSIGFSGSELAADTVPPGVPKMKKLREKLYYSLEETSDGARRVFLSTSDQEALAAITSS